jgi:tetratricopeptide (TPR) repeat protein
MPGGITVGERIVLHLSAFSRHQDDFDVPFDVSQDGIASAVRISRAHAAIELKKLRESGDVFERLAHIRRGKTRRKVYFLSPNGEQRAKDVREYAIKEGIEILPLIDLKRCDARELYESLDDEHRAVLAAASVFRRPFPRDLLPETSIPLLPSEEGMVDLPKEMREGIPVILSNDQRRRCHSLAADHWLREGDYHERLYHLIMARRQKEAEMLVSHRGEELLDEVDDDLLDTLFLLGDVSGKYASRIMYVQAEAARLCGEEERCLGLADALLASEDPWGQRMGAMVKGAILIDMDDFEKAVDVLYEHRGEGDIELECRIAEALYNLSRFDEAEMLLEELMERNRRASAFDLTDLIFYHMAMLLKRKGDPREAVRYLSKGIGMSKGADRGIWYLAMADAYRAMGMKEKAAEYTGLLRRSGSA